MTASFTRRSTLFAFVLAVSSCYAEDKEQAIFDFLNKEEAEQAIAVLDLDECEMYVDACAKLGVGLFQYEPHIELGRQYLERAAAAGHPRGKVVLANFLIDSEFYEKDAERGLQLLEEAVELGASEGMYYLAWQYTQGVNVEKDDVKALELYSRASDAGHIHAPYNAGVLHWQLYQDCRTTEKYFALGATFTDDALKAHEEILTQEPCASLLETGQYVPNWQFDDVIEQQLSDTVEQLEELRDYGVPEGAELKLKYFFNTNDENKAASLHSALTELGYSAEYSLAPSSETVYFIDGWTLPIATTEESATSWTESMCRLGFEHDAEFTGWGTNPEQ